jgi:hypothetical protein
MTSAELLNSLITGGVSFRTQVLAVISSLALLAVVVRLIRGGQLKPGYSIGWFAVGAGMVLFSLFSPLLSVFASLLGISYAPAAFLLVLVAGLFFMALHYSVMVSAHDKKIRELAQEHALLRADRFERKSERGKVRQSKSVVSHETL